MANTDFFLESLTEIETPEIMGESITFSYKTALDANLASDNDPFQKPEKLINGRIKLKIFDKYNPQTGRGYWKNSPLLSKYLKYKVIASIDAEEKSRLLSNVYEINKLGGSKIQTITLDDFKLERTDQFTRVDNTPFYTYYEVNIQKEKVSDFINDLSFIIFPYFDQEEICKDFNITLENVIDIQKFFFGKPIVINVSTTTRAQKSDRRFINSTSSITIIDLTSIENLKQDFYLPLKLKKVPVYKNYFSDLFAADDFLNFFSSKVEDTIIDTTTPNPNKSNLGSKRVVRFGFFFDKLRFVKENSAFPQLFSSAVPKITQDYVEEQVKILKLSVIRKRKNRVTQTSGFEERIIAEDITSGPTNVNKGFVIGPLKIAGVDKIDFYSGIDFDISDVTSGEYTYSVKVKVFDPTYTAVNTLRAGILEFIKIVNIYKSIMDQPIIQYEEARDVNPYVDVGDDNQKYNFKNYGYNVKENRYVLDVPNTQSSKDALTNVINKFIELHKIFNTDSNYTDNDYENLKQTLLLISLPPIGNPEGSQLLLDLLHQVLDSLNAILVSSSPAGAQEIEGYIPPQEPNAFKELSIEKEFTNFTADARMINNFGLNYHLANKNIAAGLLAIPNVQDEFADPFDTALKPVAGIGYQRFKSLKEVYLPTKNLFLKIPVTQNDFVLDSQQSLNLDSILSLSKYQNIETIISTFDTGLLLNNIKSSEQAISAFKDIVFSGFNVVSSNRFSVNNPEYFATPKSSNDIVTNINQTNAISNLRKLYNQVVFRILSLGLLNYTEMGAVADKSLADKQQDKLYDRVIYSQNFSSIISLNVRTTRLLGSSAFKLLNNTYKKASFVSFQIIDETNKNNPLSNIQYDKYYNLKDPIVKNISLVGTSIKANEILLGYLSDYVDPDNYLYEQPYENVPIINRYFLFNKSLIQDNISEGQSMTTEEVGTDTGVAVQAQILSTEEQPTQNIRSTELLPRGFAQNLQTAQEQVQQTAEAVTTAEQRTAFSNVFSSVLSKSNKI